MTTILLVIHLILAVALVGIILLQRSEGGGLGIGGSSGGGGLFTTKETANLLTRTTAILATCFMVSSLTLAILANRSSESVSILDAEEPVSTPFEATVPEAPLEAMPPAAPSAPLGE
ncbi:MAG: preprotein translocase subunit SecG [Rhodospirillaceae bacterium]|nr:MAG: preprotein translocase subunit SecG [Rhodospirillaceae bacterium]